MTAVHPDFSYSHILLSSQDSWEDGWLAQLWFIDGGNAKTNWFKNSEPTGTQRRRGMNTQWSLMLPLPEKSCLNFFLELPWILPRSRWEPRACSLAAGGAPGPHGGHHLLQRIGASWEPQCIFFICCDSVAGGGAERLLLEITQVVMQLYTS